jgi:integrase/recombinase XerD
MTKYNAQNERIKRQYLEWEKEAKGKASSTINNMRDALYRFEEHIQFKNFKQVTRQDILSFKKQLKQTQNQRTGNAVSKTYLLHTSKHLIAFFQWLYSQPGFKRSLSVTDISYFNLSAKDVQIARSAPSKRYPTLEQIEHVIKMMPSETEIQKRNRALVSFLALSGGRVTAIASMKLKHVFLNDKRIEQHPQEVKTKYSKKIVTYFFPVGDYLESIFINWVHFLKQEKLLDHNAPLFPSTKLSLNDSDQFTRQDLDTTAWQSTASIRAIVKDSFLAAGLDYYNPHSFRNTIVQLGYKYCKTPEEFKAWSQNLGHSSPLTTFTSYGSIDEFNQGEIIKGLKYQDEDKPVTKKELEMLLKSRLIK